MRRFRLLALVLLTLVVTAGVAVAADNLTTTKAVTATFTAAPDPDNDRRVCTGTDGTYHIDRGVYRGTITGNDPRLNGKIVIRARSVVNITTGLGFTRGVVVLRDAETNRVKGTARLEAVNTQRGKLDGFLTGRVAQPHARLFANFTAAFNTQGTSLSGQIGLDAPVPPTNSAVLFDGPCRNAG